MSHETQHITDPHVYRLHVSVTPTAVVFAWDYPGSTLLTVLIQRSDAQFAHEPYQGAGPDKHTDDQDLVYQGDTGSFRDDDVVSGHMYFYTMWAWRPGDQAWTSWGHKSVRAGHRPRWRLRLARLRGRV